MKGQECYHCKQIVLDKDKKSHDCWTTTEEKLTEHLPEDLLEAWWRIRETAMSFGEQRVYASHKSIMFSRKACYFFVRPQKKYLELCFFLGRTEKSSLIKKSHQTSKVKVGHITRVIHRDEVESPLTDWLKEAYDYSELARTLQAVSKKKSASKKIVKKLKKKPKAKAKKKAKKHSNEAVRTGWF